MNYRNNKKSKQKTFPLVYLQKLLKDQFLFDVDNHIFSSTITPVSILHIQTNAAVLRVLQNKNHSFDAQNDRVGSDTLSKSSTIALAESSTIIALVV